MFDVAAGEITILRGRTESTRTTCGSIRETVETAYREEIYTFVDAIVQRTQWPCPYARSAAATATLAAAERSAATGGWERVDPSLQPGHLPLTADQAS